ncbi:DNA primase family protein [Adlercreutzia caecimuris]|uniref:DNA primase family protein n=1 Tax=Adlercreutzia caecimuris TaxID=671266 RepID=UPI001C3DA800|nr:phage/plasmid primase, P4 family [Adlercreutzia caecimuris]MCR2038284.1 phage/plasmid primase, P4 family [Adlercreutzia caecimuris]
MNNTENTPLPSPNASSPVPSAPASGDPGKASPSPSDRGGNAIPVPATIFPSGGELYGSQDAFTERVAVNWCEHLVAHGGACPSLREFAAQLLAVANTAISTRNRALRKDDLNIHGKWRPMRELPASTIAAVLRSLCRCRAISLSFAGTWADLERAPREKCLVGFYIGNPASANYGTYATDEATLANLVREMRPNAGERDIKQVRHILVQSCPIATPYRDGRLIAVQNGLFDDVAKTLLPFTPDIVFLNKIAVPYNPNAALVVIKDPVTGEPWDVDSWIDSLTDDPEVRHQIWSLLAAMIRSNRRWDKAVLLVSESGENGKGTLMRMAECLIGSGSMLKANMEQLSVDAYLERAPVALVIYGDENNHEMYIDDATNLKSLVTGDPIGLNRKYQSAIEVYFHGLIVQSCNGIPKFRDRSGSLARRFALIPFGKCFTGKANKAIKEDYVQRPGVLEYVLKKLLEMDEISLEGGAASWSLLEKMKQENSSGRAFCAEIMPELAWEYVPADFLYELYVEWYAQSNSGQKRGSLNRKNFLEEAAKYVAEFGDWVYCAERKHVTKEQLEKCCYPEPLIAQFDLERWANEDYWPDCKTGAALFPKKHKEKYTGHFSWTGAPKMPRPEDAAPASETPEGRAGNQVEDAQEGLGDFVDALYAQGAIGSPVVRSQETGQVIYDAAWRAKRDEA